MANPQYNKMMKQVQEMQRKMAQAQEELAVETVEASAGGGAITVVVTGALEVKEVRIKPDAVDPEDVEMLQDLVVAAVNEALRAAQDLCDERRKALRNESNGMRVGMPDAEVLVRHCHALPTPEMRAAEDRDCEAVCKVYPNPAVTLDDLVRHIEHAVAVAGIDHVGIERGTAKAADLGEGDIEADRRAIGSGRRHGFDDVGHGDDACFQQDIVAGQAARVAAAVQPFVVLVHDLRDGAYARERRQDLCSYLGMDPDHPQLRVVQAIGLGEDGQRDGDVADVVHGSGHVQGATSGFGQLQPLGDELGAAGDAALVLRRVGIEDLGHAAQRACGRQDQRVGYNIGQGKLHRPGDAAARAGGMRAVAQANPRAVLAGFQHFDVEQPR